MKRQVLPTVVLLALCYSLDVFQHSAYSDTLPQSDQSLESLPAIQPLNAIRQSVKTFVSSAQSDETSVSVQVKELDRRLRLAHCLVPLTANWSPGSRTLGRVTVQVSCTSPKPWRVHVQATVTMQGMVWTLARGVRRGDILSADLLVRQTVTLGANNAAFTSLGTPVDEIEPWIGFAFAQRVNAGKVLNERMLKAPKLVRKGEAVVIRHRSKGLELQTRGVALSDAGASQQTQVRNSSSGKIIDVVVVANGTVEILQ